MEFRSDMGGYLGFLGGYIYIQVSWWGDKKVRRFVAIVWTEAMLDFC
jgi:hypothetical protein